MSLTVPAKAVWPTGLMPGHAVKYAQRERTVSVCHGMLAAAGRTFVAGGCPLGMWGGGAVLSAHLRAASHVRPCPLLSAEARAGAALRTGVVRPPPPRRSGTPTPGVTD